VRGEEHQPVLVENSATGADLGLPARIARMKRSAPAAPDGTGGLISQFT
jgi:hypothetical protein